MIYKTVGILALGAVVYLTALPFFTAEANAENMYIAGSYDMIDIDGLTDHTGYTVTVGKQFNDLVGFEVYTLASSSTEGYSGVNIDIDSLYGFNLTFGLPINDSAYVYAMLGHAEAKASASYMGYSESVNESSTSFGVGFRYELLEQYTLKVEYFEPVDDVDVLRLKLQLNF